MTNSLYCIYMLYSNYSRKQIWKIRLLANLLLYSSNMIERLPFGSIMLVVMLMISQEYTDSLSTTEHYVFEEPRKPGSSYGVTEPEVFGVKCLDGKSQ